MSFSARVFIFIYAISLMFQPTLTIYKNTPSEGYNDHNQRFHLFDRTKKMATNFENILRKIKYTTHDLGKNIYDRFDIGFKNLNDKNSINDDDIRQYEHLVIMKKYPYLDTHELEMKYIPVSLKRHSDSLYLDRNEQCEPSVNEQEDLLNVEITNRGLSGFAIPPQLAKHTKYDSKNTIKSNGSPDIVALPKKTPHQDVLRSLTEDINAYIERKNVEQ